MTAAQTCPATTSTAGGGRGCVREVGHRGLHFSGGLSWLRSWSRAGRVAELEAELDRVRGQRDKLLARLEADPDRAAVAALAGLRKVWTEDDQQAMLILDWIGVAGGLSLAERVRILALMLATKQGYSLDEAERLCPPAEVCRV